MKRTENVAWEMVVIFLALAGIYLMAKPAIDRLRKARYETSPGRPPAAPGTPRVVTWQLTLHDPQVLNHVTQVLTREGLRVQTLNATQFTVHKP